MVYQRYFLFMIPMQHTPVYYCANFGRYLDNEQEMCLIVWFALSKSVKALLIKRDG